MLQHEQSRRLILRWVFAPFEKRLARPGRGSLAELPTHHAPDELRAELGEEEIRVYLHYLMEERKVSQSVLVQTYSALKFFFEKTLR
jgi:hypothetical protein